MNKNPFITSGYVSADYFCDREEESKEIIRDIEGRNNKVIISPRRMGKTGLILHCFQQPELHEHYYCFFIDIYSTLTLSDFIALLGNKICETLKPKGKNAVEAFCRIVRSLEFRIGFDTQGQIEASFGIGDIKDPQRTLDEIFTYLNKADKPCVVAIDEFQQSVNIPKQPVTGQLSKMPSKKRWTMEEKCTRPCSMASPRNSKHYSKHWHLRGKQRKFNRVDLSESMV